MIELKQLEKRYYRKGKTVTILDGVNLAVNQGEILGIIGKSGAGKSTLLKCINLLNRPDSGSVVIDGVNLATITKSQLRQQRTQIGVIFQHFNLLNAKTVFANIALPLILQGGFSKSQISLMVYEMLQLVGLENFANHYPSQLSGGQKQRVGIARALITKPKVLLSDEATSALDKETTDNTLDLLLRVNKIFGITIILITHEIAVVRKICDTIAVLDEGKIVEYGSNYQILLHPKHSLTRKLIIEKECDEYLKQIQGLHQVANHVNTYLILLSFIGEITYKPILSIIAKESGVEFSILRGELGLIKQTPFGQLLIKFEGDAISLDKALLVMNRLRVHYEIIAQ